MTIQRYNGRGKTGLGNGRRNLGRDEMGKGRRREKREKGAYTFTFLNVIKLTSPSLFFILAFGIAGMWEEAAVLH